MNFLSLSCCCCFSSGTLVGYSVGHSHTLWRYGWHCACVWTSLGDGCHWVNCLAIALMSEHDSLMRTNPAFLSVCGSANARHKLDCAFCIIYTDSGHCEFFSMPCTEIFFEDGNTSPSFVTFFLLLVCSLGWMKLNQGLAPSVQTCFDTVWTQLCGGFQTSLASHQAVLAELFELDV